MGKAGKRLACRVFGGSASSPVLWWLMRVLTCPAPIRATAWSREPAVLMPAVAAEAVLFKLGLRVRLRFSGEAIWGPWYQ